MNTIHVSRLRAEVYRLLCLMTLAVVCALCITLAGCATPPAAIRGHDAFVAETSPRSMSGPNRTVDVARCFEETARFLPLSEFSRGADTGLTYRLRIADLWFEQFLLVAEGSGSRVEVRVSPGLDDKWLAQLERDRIEPMHRCLAG